MLPALPGELTSELPAVDRARLAMLDELIATLVAEARARGFSEPTIRSVLAARERLYAERGVAWRRLVLYGEPLAAVERFGDDAAAARSWVRNRLRAAVRDHVGDTIRTGRWGGRDRSYRSVPYFEAWAGKLDPFDDGSNQAVSRAYTRYVAWLDRRGHAVVRAADKALARHLESDLQGDITRAALVALTEFSHVAFEELDDLFVTHIRRGIVQVRQFAVRQAEPPTDRRNPLRRLAGRLVHEPPPIGARKDSEYRALFDFFDVARSMTTLVAELDGAPRVARVVDRFKAVTGLYACERAVLGKARKRLDRLVNRDTAFEFLSRFDPEVRRPPRRDRRGGREPVGDPGPGKGAGPERGPDPVTFTERAGGSSVTFARTVPDDPEWSRVLTTRITAMFETLMRGQTITPEFAGALCRAARDQHDRDPREEEGRLEKRVLNHLARTYHPDVRPADGPDDAGADANQRALGGLVTLHRRGRLRIHGTREAMTIEATSPT